MKNKVKTFGERLAEVKREAHYICEQSEKPEIYFEILATHLQIQLEKASLEIEYLNEIIKLKGICS